MPLVHHVKETMIKLGMDPTPGLASADCVLALRPMPGSASISMVNAGLEGFVRAAALELPRKLRMRRRGF
jgi:hypothetical protein